MQGSITRHRETERRKDQKPRRRQRGASLIEVLVAMLVMAIGLLGSTGAQLTSLRLSESARQVSEATLLLQDMLERMHANPQGVASGAYLQSGADTATEAETETNENEDSNACLTLPGCAPDVMAARDLQVWQASLAHRLPGGTGQVCPAAPDPDELSGEAAGCAAASASQAYLVIIEWDGNRDGLNDQKLHTVFAP